MLLTDITVRRARATSKPYILGDSRRLALNVTANGGKSWHFRYQWLGKAATNEDIVPTELPEMRTATAASDGCRLSST